MHLAADAPQSMMHAVARFTTLHTPHITAESKLVCALWAVPVIENGQGSSLVALADAIRDCFHCPLPVFAPGENPDDLTIEEHWTPAHATHHLAARVEHLDAEAL